jgi:hypothetical protein
VLLALFRLARQHIGRLEIPFTLYQVCQELLWTTEGRRIAMVKEALRQWTGTFIQFENSFRRGDSWRSEKGFNIICWYELTKGEDFDPREPHKEQVFVLNPKVVESIQNRHTKELDWDFYRRIESGVAKRLFRLLDKRFHKKDFYTPRMPFVPFCCEKIGMSRGYRKPAKYRERFQPAADELVAKGFLSSFRFREKDGVCRVEFRKRSRRRLRPRQSNPVSENPQLTGIARELLARGVAPRQFVGPLPDEIIREAIEVHDDLVEKKDPKVSRNPSGYLASYLRSHLEGNGWKPHKGFQTKAEKRQESKEARKKELAQANAEKKRLETDAAKTRAERERVHEYLASLTSDEEREKFEALAVASSGGEWPRLYRLAKRDQESGKLSPKQFDELYRVPLVGEYLDNLEATENASMPE